MCCYYNPQQRFISNHLIDIGRNLDTCDLYGMKSLIKIPMCYKNLANSARIDLMLSNSKRSFQNSCTIETRLSINTVLNIYFQKRKAKVINYRDYQNFLNEEFRQQVLKDILSFLMNFLRFFKQNHFKSYYGSIQIEKKVFKN